MPRQEVETVTEESPGSVLVIVAHPDDAEFTCGATVARWCVEGREVNFVLVTSGDMGSHDEEMTREKLGRLREREQLAAAKVLGVRECVFLRYPDGFVEDTAELRGLLVREVRRFRPETVVTWDPHRSFNHRDHRLTGQAALDAVYPLSRSHLGYPEHLEEGLQPHGVREVLLIGADEPDYHVDVSAYLNAKLRALRKHRSQVGRGSARDLRKRIRERMVDAGKAQGYALAEAFRRIAWS